MEIKTQIGQIAQEEHATCYICGFSDNYDDMIRVASEEEGDHWAHRECYDDMNAGIKPLL